MTTSVPRNESELQQYRVLERANLLQYFDIFISQGGDDVRQLCEAGEDEFLEIMALVGMASKPLHVRRLQKSLQEWINYPAKFQSPYNESSPISKLPVKDEMLSNNSRNNNSVFPSALETISQFSQTEIRLPHESLITINESVKRISKSIECEPNLEVIANLNFSCSCSDIEGLFATTDLSRAQIEMISTQAEIIIDGIAYSQQGYIKEAAKQLCISNPALLTHCSKLYDYSLKVLADAGLNVKQRNLDSCQIEENNIMDRLKELDDNLRVLNERQESTTGTDAASRDNIAAILTLKNKLMVERTELLKNSNIGSKFSSGNCYSTKCDSS